MSAQIKIEGLSLQVPLFVQNERSVRSWRSLLFNALFDPPHREFRTLLESISLEVNEGERVAILGRNGAGKSTLLRCLNGVYRPTRGSVSISGSCQALLNTSLGFNGEATVKENIFLRANAMRLDRVPIAELIRPVLEFAGLTDKANHRLKTLSAGQRMRLGFAISTEVQHDIMLLDEWVGAGDSEFLRRAKQRMSERLGGSKIVMLASHNFSLLKDICNKGLVLENGRIVFYGPLNDAFKAYQTVASNPVPQQSHSADDGVTTGCVDEVSYQDGRLRVRGWAIHESGHFPKVLSIISAKETWLVTEVVAKARPDVREALGLPDDHYGYEVDICAPELGGLPELSGILQVYGGASKDNLTGPFRMESAVLNALIK